MLAQMGQVGRMENVVQVESRATSISPKAIQGEMETVVCVAKMAERGVKVRAEVILLWTYLAVLQSYIFLAPVQLLHDLVVRTMKRLCLLTVEEETGAVVVGVEMEEEVVMVEMVGKVPVRGREVMEEMEEWEVVGEKKGGKRRGEE